MVAKKKKDVIEWRNPGADDIVWRFSNHDNTIRYGAVLIVREWEAAVFLRDGKLFDVFGPGRHILSTQNLPLITRAYNLLLGYGESPFKAEIIFFSKKMFNGRWGMRTMVKASDDVQAPMPLMANGDYQFRLDDPILFITQILGGKGQFSTEDASIFLKGFLNEKLIQELSKYTYMDVYSNLEATSRKTQVNIAEAFTQRGVQLLSLRINGVDTEEDYKKDLYKFQRFRSDAGRDYRQMEIMEKMAEAVGTSSGAGVGTGMLLFPQMYQQMSQSPQQASQQSPKILCPHCSRPNEYPYQFCNSCGKPPIQQQEPPKANPSAGGEPMMEKERVDDFNICPFCGKSLKLPKTPMFCPYCKEKLTM